MHSKKPNTPMTRIQERAPEDKWMRDAGVAPSAIHERTGIVDAADLYRRREEEKAAAQAKTGVPPVAPSAPVGGPPEVFEGVNAHSLERRTAATAAAQGRADILEAEKEALENKLAITGKTLSDVQVNMGDLRSRVKKLKTDLNNERAKSKQSEKLVAELQEDRRTEAAEYAEKMGAMTTKIEELESQGGKPVEVEVEVEVYPSRIVINEITNTIRKNNTIIFKTQVQMDEEMIPMTIRVPFKKMQAAMEKGDRDTNGDEE